jgi:hypothetical protein
LAQTQVWPVLRYLEAIAPSTAASRSASSKTMKGALPPSSSETFFTVARALRIRMLADLGRAGEGELAHDRVRRHLAADRAGLAGDDVEARRPECRRARASSASASAESGVWLGRLDHHGAAGGQRRAGLAGDHRAGKFHGVIAAHHADRLLDHDDALVGRWVGITSP